MAAPARLCCGRVPGFACSACSCLKDKELGSDDLKLGSTPEAVQQGQCPERDEPATTRWGSRTSSGPSTAGAFPGDTLLIPLRCCCKRRLRLLSPWMAYRWLSDALPCSPRPYIPVALEKGGLDVPLLVTRDQECGACFFAWSVAAPCRNYLHWARSRSRTKPASPQQHSAKQSRNQTTPSTASRAWPPG